MVKVVDKKTSKAQNAIELLATYGWAIVAMLGLIGVLYYLGVFNISLYSPQSCYLGSDLSCDSYKISGNGTGFTLFLSGRNNLGFDIGFDNQTFVFTTNNLGLAGEQSYNGTCAPAKVVAGKGYSCVVQIPYADRIPKMGSLQEGSTSLTYRNCESSSDYATTGNCTGIAHTIIGSIVTQIEQESSPIIAGLCGNGLCEDNFGETNVTCWADCGEKVYALSLSAVPASLPPDNVSISIITANVYDQFGHPYAYGNETILFTKNSSNGAFSVESDEMDSGGVASTIFTVGNATENFVITATLQSNTSLHTQTTISVCTGCGSYGWITGFAKDSIGTAISDANISSGNLSDMSTENGSYFIHNVPPGRYRFNASAPGFLNSSQNITVYAGTESKVNFTLNLPEGWIYGRVLAWNGTALENATVNITGVGSNTTNSTGDYIIYRVPYGTHEVTASFNESYENSTQTVFALSLQGVSLNFTMAPAGWWNANWSYKYNITLSNGSNYLRNKEIYARYFTFASGKVVNCTNDLRVVANYQNITEIASRIWNETYSEGYCVGATVTWILNLTTGTKNATYAALSDSPNYWLYFDNSLATAPSYGNSIYDAFNDSSTKGLYWFDGWDQSSSVTDYSGNGYTIGSFAASGSPKIGVSNQIPYLPVANLTQASDGGFNANSELRTLLSSKVSAEFMGSPSFVGSEYSIFTIGSTVTDFGLSMRTSADNKFQCYDVVNWAMHTTESSALPNNQWVSLACTFNKDLGSSRLKNYVNGTLVQAADSANGDLRSGSGSVDYLTYADNPGYGFRGLAEVLRISNAEKTPTDNVSSISNMFLPFSNPLTADVSNAIGLTGAYGTLEGYVFSSTGSAVQDANVSISNMSNVTDYNGYYTIYNIDAGEYTATVSASGFMNETQNVTISTNAVTTANFTLSAWPYYQAIQLDSTVASDLTNFPAKVVIDTTNATLWNTTTCTNVRFKSTSGDTLNYELDSGCNSASTIFWVGTNLTGGANTTIYAYLGNTAAADGQNAQALWRNASYFSAWHFNSISSLADSAGRNNLTQQQNTCALNTSGGIGNGIFFNGSCLYGSTSVTLPSGNMPVTVSIWSYNASPSIGDFFDFGCQLTHNAVGQQIGSDTTNYGYVVNNVYFDSFLHVYSPRVSGSNFIYTRDDGMGTRYMNVTNALGSSVNSTSVTPAYGGTGMTVGMWHWSGSSCVVNGTYSTRLSNTTLYELRFRNASSSTDWLAAEYAQGSTVGSTVLNGDWPYGTTITLNSTVASTLTNFPAKVVLDTTNTTLWNTTTCTNVRFKDADGTGLNYDLDSGCGTNTTTFWVGIPSLTQSTTIYAYLGNTAATSGENSFNVWNASGEYAMVYHLEEDGASTGYYVDEMNNRNATVVTCSSGEITYPQRVSTPLGYGMKISNGCAAYATISNPTTMPYGNVNWGFSALGRNLGVASPAFGILDSAAGTSTGAALLFANSDTTTVANWDMYSGGISVSTLASTWYWGAAYRSSGTSYVRANGTGNSGGSGGNYPSDHAGWSGVQLDFGNWVYLTTPPAGPALSTGEMGEIRIHARAPTADWVDAEAKQTYAVATDPAPTYSTNSTNTTQAGASTLFSLAWADNSALSGYIFSFDNGAGTFVNDSWVAMTGASNWSNVTKAVNSTIGSTIRWCVYANDTSNNLNSTSCASPFSYTSTAPFSGSGGVMTNFTNATGTYIVHKFTSNGTFTATGTGNVMVLVVAGGGGGGYGRGGGGGAGGLIYNSSYAASGSITVSIGAGGAEFSNGKNSTFGTLTAVGGGGGGGEVGSWSPQTAGFAGGSGGGGAAPAAAGGSPTSGQGNTGGAGGTTTNYNAGGGGGAGAVGTAGTASNGGNGGAGATYAINGSSVCYAGGGGGGGNAGTPGTATCGGGAGKVATGVKGDDATANTGGGGGGGAGTVTRGHGGLGGSGVVIVSYRYTDIISPAYATNSTNTTQAGASTLFSLAWTDTIGLSGYIFSFDNGTGTFVNDSWVAMTGTSNWSNVTKTVNSTGANTIRWCVYANDTSNNFNNTCGTPFSYTSGWWNSSWALRVSMSVSDSAKYIRFKEPVANYFTFDSGKVANCTNDLRITKWNGSVETEIPTKIWNETYSGGWCTGATVTWVANVTPAMGTVSEMVNNYEGISSCAWYQTGTTCEMSTVQKYSGTKSLRIRKSTTWDGGYTLGDVYAAPNFYFDPTRNFTYWVYPTSLTNITSVYVQVFGVNDVDVCTLANSSALTAGQWNKITGVMSGCSGTIPRRINRVRHVATVSPATAYSDWVYFDDNSIDTAMNQFFVSNSGTNFYLYYNDTVGASAPNYGSKIYDAFNDTSTKALYWSGTYSTTTIPDSTGNGYTVTGMKVAGSPNFTYTGSKWLGGFNFTTSSTTNQGSVPLTLRGNLTNNFSIEVVGNHGAPSGFEYLSGTSTDWGIAMSYEGASGHNCEVTLGTSYYQAMGGTVPTNTPVLTACVFNSALASNRLTSYINSTAAATNNAAAASLRTGTNVPYIYSFGYTAWQTRNAFNGIAEVTRISDMYRTPTDNSSIRSNMFLPFSNPLTITTSQ